MPSSENTYVTTRLFGLPGSSAEAVSWLSAGGVVGVASRVSRFSARWCAGGWVVDESSPPHGPMEVLSEAVS